MKRLLPVILLTVGTFFFTAANAQIVVHGRIGIPIPRLFPVPHISFYAAPAPVYTDYGRDRVIVREPRRDYDDRYHNYDRDRDFYRDRADRRHEERRENRDRDDRRHW